MLVPVNACSKQIVRMRKTVCTKKDMKLSLHDLALCSLWLLMEPKLLL